MSIQEDRPRSKELRIDAINFKGGGRLGLTFCPGKKQPHSMTGGWCRNLDVDLDAIKDAGYESVVTLMEEHEFVTYQVTGLRDGVERRNMIWRHLPIKDEGVPDEYFEAQWPSFATFLHDELSVGKAVVLHCKGGLGRTGLVAARFLIDVCGLQPNEAINLVRMTRSPHAIDRGQQENYVCCQKPGALSSIQGSSLCLDEYGSLPESF